MSPSSSPSVKPARSEWVVTDDALQSTDGKFTFGRGWIQLTYSSLKLLDELRLPDALPKHRHDVAAFKAFIAAIRRFIPGAACLEFWDANE